MSLSPSFIILLVDNPLESSKFYQHLLAKPALDQLPTFVFVPDNR
jgi:hypothetical protein